MPVTHAFTSTKDAGADATKVRSSEWNAAHAGAFYVLDRDLVLDEVVSSTTEASIYDYEIAAGLLGATGGVRLTLGGDILVNNAGTLLLSVDWGPAPTTILTTTTKDPTNSASRYKFWWEVLIMNSALAVQTCITKIMAAVDSDTFSIVRPDEDTGFYGAGYSTATVDTTAAVTLDARVKWSANSANLSFRNYFALLEFIPPA